MPLLCFIYLHIISNVRGQDTFSTYLAVLKIYSRQVLNIAIATNELYDRNNFTKVMCTCQRFRGYIKLFVQGYSVFETSLYMAVPEDLEVFFGGNYYQLALSSLDYTFTNHIRQTNNSIISLSSVFQTPQVFFLRPKFLRQRIKGFPATCC